MENNFPAVSGSYFNFGVEFSFSFFLLKLDVWSDGRIGFVLDPGRWRRWGMCDICDAWRRPHTWELSAVHDNEEVSVSFLLFK